MTNNSSIGSSAIELTSEQLQSARDWIADCSWGDLEAGEIDELSAAKVIRGIKRHYEGGIAAFVRDCQPVSTGKCTCDAFEPKNSAGYRVDGFIVCAKCHGKIS
jgi:hypothetical protein